MKQTLPSVYLLVSSDCGASRHACG